MFVPRPQPKDLTKVHISELLSKYPFSHIYKLRADTKKLLDAMFSSSAWITGTSIEM